MVHNSSELHLTLYCNLLDSILKYHIEKIRQSESNRNEYAGLTISDSEIDMLLNDLSEPATIEVIKNNGQDGGQQECNNLREQIKEFEANLLEIGENSRLSNLKQLFNLSEIEMEAFIIAFAPELSSKYEKIYVYIQNDITRKLPTVELICKLLKPLNSVLYIKRELFSSDSPLIKFDLIQLLPEPSRPHTPIPVQYIKIDNRIIHFLTGDDTPDEMICTFVTKITPVTEIDTLVLDHELCKSINNLIINKQVHLIYLHGPFGTDKREVAEAICFEFKRRLLVIHDDPFSEKSKSQYFLRRIFREALISNAFIYWDTWIQKYTEIDPSIISQIISFSEGSEKMVFIAGEQIWEPGCIVKKAGFARLTLNLPSSGVQSILWKRALNGHLFKDNEKMLGKIQSTFKLNRTQISDAAATAIRFAEQNETSGGMVSFDDINTACRIHSSSRMGNYARKINPKHDWNDIVLPAEKLLQLRELCNSIQYRSVVYGEWGFEKKLSIGKGISALFSGVSGTGKTMAAEIIANELQLELLKIDLSSVVSKYIGETEKNLSRIFDEAEHTNAILFFDEADAIMGKRSEVKDAHDRYSNIETAYLLQKMEEYSGVSLLATNFKQNIDNAFIRRIRYIIEFPFPDIPLRKDIWKKIWVPGVPLSNDIDIEFIANHFELSGGNIRNVAINAAFFAAEQEKEVAMVHILRAVKRELQKMGKVCIDHDFGKYQHLIIDKKTIEEGV